MDEIKYRHSQSAWKRTLAMNNLQFATKRTQFKLGEHQDREVSPDKVSDVDGTGVDAIISLVTDGNLYYVGVLFRLRFEIKPYPPVCAALSSGEDPLDTGGFSWSNQCWDYADDNIYETSSVSESVNPTDDASGPSSFGFEINDKEIYSEWVDSLDNLCAAESYSDYEYFGVYLEENNDPDCNSDNDTEIWGAYSHTWEGTIGNWSIGAGVGTGAMISISYGEESYVAHETTKTDKDGDFLSLTKSDADYQYRPIR